MTNEKFQAWHKEVLSNRGKKEKDLVDTRMSSMKELMAYGKWLQDSIANGTLNSDGSFV